MEFKDMNHDQMAEISTVYMRQNKDGPVFSD